MNIIAQIGHNAPPSEIDDITAPYDDFIAEAQNWADGTPVTNAEQMAAVDALIRQIKAAEKAVSDARDAATKPLHSAWQDEIARWKPTLVDLDRIKKCLISAVDGFKRKLAAEKEEARRVAESLAWEKTRAAQVAARAADASNIDAQRAAAQAEADALAAQRAASAAKGDTVKGLRTVTETVVLDEVALARWLWANDRAAQVEFQADRARKLSLDILGVVERRTERRAY